MPYHPGIQKQGRNLLHGLERVRHRNEDGIRGDCMLAHERGSGSGGISAPSKAAVRDPNHFKIQIAKRVEAMALGESSFFVAGRVAVVEAEKGVKVIKMHIGQPDFPTPTNIREAAKKAIDDGHTGYTAPGGLRKLQEAIAVHASKMYGVEINPYKEVVIGPGGKPLIYAAIAATVNPGDEVIYPCPGYPAYEEDIKTLGGRAVALPLKLEEGFNFDDEKLAGFVTDKTKAIVINSPSNPTGGVLSEEQLRNIAELVKEKDLFVISDEIYSNILYDGSKHRGIISLPGMKERTIIIDGFSKSFSMTGWRLGYAIAPAHIVESMTKFANDIWSCSANFTQMAGIEAISSPASWRASGEMVREFQKRRDVIVKALNGIPGVKCLNPLGAFYVFPRVGDEALQKAGVRNTVELEYALLEGLAAMGEKGVRPISCLAGTAFGEYGAGHMRLSFATSMEDILEAMATLKKVLTGELVIPREKYAHLVPDK
jgi:aspartate/methionine/tyrosine aminotransferase